MGHTRLQKQNMIFTLLSILFLLGLVQATVKLDTKSRKFVDEYGRTRIFHGMNAVYKIAPWHPKLHGYDAQNTLSKIDSKNLKSWGLNMVRLGVMWPGVEPGQRGEYNQTYLDNIREIVDTLAEDDIYVILDFHQDIWHRKFCGEGVPDYVFDICKAAEPEGTPPFPSPASNLTYPLNEDGEPDLDMCLSKMFAAYYLTYEVSAGFQCLYDNVDGLWDAFAGYWKTVAARFNNSPKVVGYELINEPWAGDIFNSPKNLLPKYAEQTYLQPMYEYLHKAIREVDDEKIIFFEGLTIDYWPGGFTAGPGGEDYNDRQALAYHIYCPFNQSSVWTEISCAALDDYFLSMRLKDSERMGVGMIMTEFGALEDVKGDMIALEKTAELMDKYQQSWLYWQLKYYQDLTTVTPVGESMYDEDGKVSQHKLKILSRTYPHAVAGQLNSFSFDVLTAKFNMEYSLLSVSDELKQSKENEELSQTTLVYFNKDLHYPLGINVVLSGEGQEFVQVKCPESLEEAGYLKLSQALVQQGSAVVVNVEITKCVTDCTCKF